MSAGSSYDVAALPERFQRKIAVDAQGCWIWTGGISSTGYGSLRRLDGTSTSAHQGVHELLVGGVAKGMHLDHLCRVRACCNPAHLEIVTPRENTMRSTNAVAEFASRDHCSAGHVYATDGVYVVKKSGQRQCLPCKRARDVEYRQRHKPWQRRAVPTGVVSSCPNCAFQSKPCSEGRAAYALRMHVCSRHGRAA